MLHAAFRHFQNLFLTNTTWEVDILRVDILFLSSLVNTMANIL